MMADASAGMGDLLGSGGNVETEDPAKADIVILNTCHIRERATEKVFSELGRVRETKLARAAEGQETQIGVAGCVAQGEGAGIIARQPAVDIVVGPQAYDGLPGLLAAGSAPRAAIAADLAARDKFAEWPD